MSPANESGAPPAMTVAQSVNRGFNLMASAILGLAGAAFSELIASEPDTIDKLDNTLLLLIGLIAVLWYVWSGQQWKRTPVPLIFAGVALLGQLLGIGIEIGDSAAVGDDFGGLVIYLLTLVLLVGLYQYNRRYLGAPSTTAPA
jgi:hypothetical protein